ncbi:hypothetical protein SISNIDRAFT_494566 [Sistotremastrum niveocremeum HHB9708]|uniref:A-kinase anchor protein 7-like phosphoesterase domain-containing protein n=1 Tax=Sistotremastrum niveocremeum HHB9708 TaxID=1314777 RepID=A0A164WMD9_9AGAM|nr:hypothetical protein SISNIDRAFT_494566 [Sistotremastrum niveocremeum HHB9708]
MPPSSSMNSKSHQARPPHRTRPALTHCLSLPPVQGFHPGLREKVTAFTTALRQEESPIPGLHESIIVNPRKLHLTLGVLSLASDDNPANEADTHTITSALNLLHSLSSKIGEILDGEKLLVPLDRMNIMKPDRGDPEQAHVMWIGPSDTSVYYPKLKQVCACSELIDRTFRAQGFVTEKRPLKLHCTLLNTTYRRPRPRGNRRIPFSYSSILASTALKSILEEPSTIIDAKRPTSVNLGTWEVQEVQLCEMGSTDADGAYRSVGGIVL